MIDAKPELLTAEFRELSAKLGQDPLQVQGPGGNTSIKEGGVMWIKASGTELANAVKTNIFVSVDRNAALAEAREVTGDGCCRTTILDSAISLRPSIETTFHAALDHKVVVHTHSVAAITHGISPEGREVLKQKLEGLPYVLVPYAKPGLPLTRLILAARKPETRVFILQNHGLLCCGVSVAEVTSLIEDVERRLFLPAREYARKPKKPTPPSGYGWAEESWLARDGRTSEIALSGTYYPDHTVFLGPALPEKDDAGSAPAVLVKGEGVLLSLKATDSQRAMLLCLSNILRRLPEDWSVEAIGAEAEAELLNWDAEKYRQALEKTT